MQKTALVLGISGQDGAYLAQQLLLEGYVVHGTSRDPSPKRLWRLERLSLSSRLRVHREPNGGAWRACLDTLEPEEVYFLSGQSSVGRSFEDPAGTLRSQYDPAVGLLEALRSRAARTRLVVAGSAEAYGAVPENERIAEGSPRRPLSPYGVSKAHLMDLVALYRSVYDVFASTAILFNHESPLRSPEFVTQKVVSAALEIRDGLRDTVTLGRLDVVRDWGYAPEYMQALTRIARADAPEDFVIATGEGMSLQRFVELVFAEHGLDPARHLAQDTGLLRPFEIPVSVGNPERAAERLGWRAQTKGEALVKLLCDAARARVAQA